MPLVWETARTQQITYMYFDLNRFQKLNRRRKCCYGKNEIQEHPFEVP